MSRQLRCIIIDDELLALSYLRTLCAEIPDLTVVRAFSDAHLLLDELPNLRIDFCISDIVMPAMNGLELAEKLNGLPVIFTTAHNEFAADAFDINAVDYLRKPVKKERLLQAINKVRQIVSSMSYATISFSTARGKIMLDPQKIAFVSADTLDRRDKLVILESGEELILKNYSFDQLLQMLPQELFVRVSRKDLLARSIVKGHSSGTVFTNFKDKTGSERSFSLGDSYRREFMELFSF